MYTSRYTRVTEQICTAGSYPAISRLLLVLLHSAYSESELDPNFDADHDKCL